MSSLLLNLHRVPDDEADEVRALLDEHRMEYYETPPNRWGVSDGAIWLRDERDLERARSLLSGYQSERSRRAQDEYAVACRDGTAPTWWSMLRDEPMRVVVVLVAVVLMLALVALPVWLMAP